MAMNQMYPKALADVIDTLSHLPGIGRHTAQRLALALLEWSPEELRRFGEQLTVLPTEIVFCEVCGNFSDQETCRICQALDRDHGVICVVEHASQIAVIEACRGHRGMYHVLGGRLVPLEGKGPEDLRLDELSERLADGTVHEIILATSSDVEGEATAHYIAAEFARPGLTISRIAAGVPVGADLSYADSATMAMAIGGRRPFGGKGGF